MSTINPPDEIYHEILRGRREGREITQVTAPPALYDAAYRFMHNLYLQGEAVHVVNGEIVTAPGPHFPLPVPQEGYRLFSVDVRKAE